MTAMVTGTQKLAHGEKLVIGGKKFTVQNKENSPEFWLIGGRGATYFLRPFAEVEDSGLRQIVNFFAGMGEPLRDKFSRRILVFVVGDTITEVTK